METQQNSDLIKATQTQARTVFERLKARAVNQTTVRLQRPANTSRPRHSDSLAGIKTLKQLSEEPPPVE